MRKQDNRRSDGPTFKVTLGQGQGSRKIRTQENQSKGNNTRKGRMNGGNKVKGGNKKRNNVSEADLDAEMDAYHGKVNIVLFILVFLPYCLLMYYSSITCCTGSY